MKPEKARHFRGTNLIAVINSYKTVIYNYITGVVVKELIFETRF